jgi:hypothetical protein
MLTQEFCDYLEYNLPFHTSEDKDTRRCWCDGILLPENEEDYSIKTVNDKRKIETVAWIIYEGKLSKKLKKFEKDRWDTLYKMTIHFGRKSISHYVKGKNLEECVPNVGADEWIYLDIEKQIIEIQLL